jgi:hypothetical protein
MFQRINVFVSTNGVIWHKLDLSTGSIGSAKRLVSENQDILSNYFPSIYDYHTMNEWKNESINTMNKFLFPHGMNAPIRYNAISDDALEGVDAGNDVEQNQTPDDSAS